MRAFLASCVFALAATSASAQTPEPADDAPDRFGLAVTGTGSLSLWGFPLLGPGAGLAARVRILNWLSVEPHVDGLVESFIMIGVASAQIGVPLVVEGPLQEGMRTHVGVGPLFSVAHAFGHEGFPLGPYAGAEILGGVGVPLNDFLEARAQLRAHLVLGAAPLPVQMGGSGTAGIMLTF